MGLPFKAAFPFEGLDVVVHRRRRESEALPDLPDGGREARFSPVMRDEVEDLTLTWG